MGLPEPRGGEFPLGTGLPGSTCANTRFSLWPPSQFADLHAAHRGSANGRAAPVCHSRSSGGTTALRASGDTLGASADHPFPCAALPVPQVGVVLRRVGRVCCTTTLSPAR